MSPRYSSTSLHHPKSTVQRGASVMVRPVADLVEGEKGLYLYCNMPGVAAEDVIVHLENDTLHICGPTSYGPPPLGRVHALEFDEGVYEATFAVPLSVDTKGIEASMHNGVLTVFFPHPAPEGPRRIPVHAV